MLLEAGLEPTIVVGARFEAIGSNARLGEGEWFVAEADESDRSFLRLSPVCSVVTNIGLDHMDEYRDLEDLQKTFLEHMNKTSGGGLVVACGEDANLAPQENRGQEWQLRPAPTNSDNAVLLKRAGRTP